MEETMNQKLCEIDKWKNYTELLSKWLYLKNNGVNLEKFFKTNNYNNIAIYGMADLGNRLYEELKNTEIKVSYAIDKRIGMELSGVKVVSLTNNLEPVDAVVVTPTREFEQIAALLKRYCKYDVISLETVVFYDYSSKTGR